MIDPSQFDPEKIRTFAIIAHIDHGKSTLADRFLEITKTVPVHKTVDRILDSMDLEKEKGITIKAHPVSMLFTSSTNQQQYLLNAIDTPGHVDFTYEVSRALASCEGVLLLIDATQGVQAQTLANLYLAVDNNLTIIPVLNKIDLPAADLEKSCQQIKELLGINEEEIILCSAKTGEGVEEILEAIIERIPHPDIKQNIPKGIIFDSVYDNYRGIIAYVRVLEGAFKKGDQILFMHTEKKVEIQEVGVFMPNQYPTQVLCAGNVGYIVAGIKEVNAVKIGDTITSAHHPISEPLPGMKSIHAAVYAGIYPIDTKDFEDLKTALYRLQLNDSALEIEKEKSSSLGFGFRCGFLGLLHLEITTSRLQREYNLDIITCHPSVLYRCHIKHRDEIKEIHTPAFFPDISLLDKVEEPWVTSHVIAPNEFFGAISILCKEKRGICINTETLDLQRMIYTYELPLNEILTDFNDILKSITSGFASFDYEFLDYRIGSIVKLDVRINDETVDAFCILTHQLHVERKGRMLCKKLKELIPRALFRIHIQAVVNNKVIASETLSAISRNVADKCYGGDITRKRKLWNKQKEGKKKMKQFGKVSIPQETFISILKTDNN